MSRSNAHVMEEVHLIKCKCEIPCGCLQLLQFLFRQLHKFTYKLLNNIPKIFHYQILLNVHETKKVVSKEKLFKFLREDRGPAIDNTQISPLMQRLAWDRAMLYDITC